MASNRAVHLSVTVGKPRHGQCPHWPRGHPIWARKERARVTERPASRLTKPLYSMASASLWLAPELAAVKKTSPRLLRMGLLWLSSTPRCRYFGLLAATIGFPLASHLQSTVLKGSHESGSDKPTIPASFCCYAGDFTNWVSR